MKLSSKMRALVKKCQKHPAFFIQEFGSIKHPMAGIIPFQLFSYQRKSIQTYRKSRFSIYRKCRQSGISTLAGIYALWLAMFHAHATVLIVSKRDEDAKDFMSKNIKLPYEYLPKSFRQIWGDLPKTYSAHQVIFKNGSSIKCLPSGKDTLRSNSSTLNIIDESAFCPDMAEMWAGAAPTLMHGGQVIVISTSKGKGNWYHNTWVDAEAGQNEFAPIQIMWWDMDWVIEFPNKDTGETTRICPLDGMRDSVGEEKEMYGPYWSPWLEQQYRVLQEQGEAHKFKEEILAEFLGTGNTVVDTKALIHVEKTRSDNYQTVQQTQYIHPMTDERVTLDFANQLRVWKTPVRPEQDVIDKGRIVIPGKAGHTYSIGVDISTGEANDYSGIQVIDVDNMEQAAELKIKTLPRILAMMVDYLARWYNNALVVPERTGIGAGFCQELETAIGYHNVFRKLMPSGKRNKKTGYETTGAGKPIIDKHLMDMLGEEGCQIFSHRLWKELNIYVYLTTGKTGAEPGIGNHDDLVIAMGLALIGIRDAMQMDMTAMLPSRGSEAMSPLLVQQNQGELGAVVDSTEEQRRFAAHGGMGLLMPMSSAGGDIGQDPAAILNNADAALERFTMQIGGLTVDQLRNRMQNVTSPKHDFRPKKGKINL